MRARWCRYLKLRAGQIRERASKTAHGRLAGGLAYRTLRAAQLFVFPFVYLSLLIGRMTGLDRLPRHKFVVCVLMLVTLVFSQFATMVQVEATGTERDTVYSRELMSEDSFIEKYGHGTGNPMQITHHTVADGESLASIAQQYNVKVQSIVSANKLQSTMLKPGQELNVYNIDGMLYTVAKNDTLEKISKKFSVNEEIARWYNGLSEDAILHAGDELYMPGAIDPAQLKRDQLIQEGGRGGRIVPPGPNAPGLGGGVLNEPLDDYVYIRGFAGYHTGLDLANKTGTPVYAAGSGTVISAQSSGWNGGYGLNIKIDHGGGLVTVYAHLSALSVEVGTQVSTGDNIGRMGSTGRSTGPHLHFEVIDDGIKRNPMNYLQ